MKFLVPAESVLLLEFIFCTWKIVVADLADDYQREELVPDILDVAPKNLLSVNYNGKKVHFASELTPTEVQNSPNIGWSLDSSSFYTLIMIDPDAPSRQDPFLRAGLHWLLTNIPGDDFSKGDTIVQYLSCGPPKDLGFHRYTFTVYKQNGKQIFDEKPIDSYVLEGRLKFSMQKFVQKYNLGEPVLGNMFYCQYDDFVPGLHEKLGFKM